MTTPKKLTILEQTLYELGFLDRYGNMERNKERRWNININEAELILKDFMKDIADQVIEDIKKRKVQGKKKYGVPLRANNGRDALQDAYEEAQDLSLYLKQAMVERDEPTDELELEYQLSLEVARAVLAHYLKETNYTKKKRIEDKLDIVADFPVWLEKEITKLQ